MPTVCDSDDSNDAGDASPLDGFNANVTGLSKTSQLSGSAPIDECGDTGEAEILDGLYADIAGLLKTAPLSGSAPIDECGDTSEAKKLDDLNADAIGLFSRAAAPPIPSEEFSGTDIQSSALCGSTEVMQSSADFNDTVELESKDATSSKGVSGP